MKILDKIAAQISPAWALGRKRAQLALDQVLTLEQKLKGVRRYEGASQSGRTQGWQTFSTGANAEVRGSLRMLRDRSRDLVRNNPFAKKAVQVIGANVIGSGIRASAIMPRAKAKKFNAVWSSWADSSACDFDGQRDLAGIQRALVRAFCEGGECLAVRKRLTADEAARYGGIPMQIQLLEGDYIDTGKDGVLGEGNNRVIQGVEFDEKGRRVAYWLYKSHPGEAYHWGDRTSIRVPAEDVLHIYEVLRPGQVRGVPMGVSAMLRLRDFDEYEDAQLLRQKIAACFAVFYNGTEALTTIESKTDNTQAELPSEVQPGMIQKLPAGSSVTMAEPPAADGYGEYSKTVLQSIAAGYGTTYEQLTGDYSNVNYSSARMARLEMGMYVAELQELVITQFCTKVWEWFTLAAWLSGSINERVIPAKWTVPARFMLDPVKETKALKELVRAGFESYSGAVLSLGYSPDELRESIDADNKEADRLKLKTTSDPRYFQDTGVPIEPGGISSKKASKKESATVSAKS